MADDVVPPREDDKPPVRAPLPVGLWGTLGLGAYLIVFTLTVVGLLWNTVPSCDVGGMVVTGLWPSPIVGGEALHIAGEGFRRGVTVKVGSEAAKAAEVVTPFEIVVSTDKGKAGKFRVEVAQDGEPPQVIPGEVEFVISRPTTQAPPPTAPVAPTVPAAPAAPAGGGAAPPTAAKLEVAAIEPATASVQGGAAVTITGANFSEATRVFFGGMPARGRVKVDGTRFLTAVTPSHHAGPVSVLVADAQSSATLEGKFTYLCPAASDDTLIFMVILAGALGGLVHALRSFFWYVGQRELVWNWAPMYVLLPFASLALGFVFFLVIRAGLYQPTGGTHYLLVGLAALVGMFSAQAAEKLKAIAEGLFSPAPQGKDQAPPVKNVTPAPAPTIATIAPDRGAPDGGETVTIAGTGFAAGTTVRFGASTAIAPTAIGPTKLTVVTPKGKVGEALKVSVEVPGKPVVESPRTYAYVQPSGSITTITPNTGKIGGGEQVRLAGTKLSKDVTVRFGDAEPQPVTAVDAVSVDVKAPARTEPGPVDIRVEDAAGLVAVAPGGYRYVP